jgi:DNA-binding beta-propeller fold protein YncE
MRLSLFVILLLAVASQANAQLLISGNENKIDLSSGSQQTVSDAEPDSLTFLDFSTFPPTVEHVVGVRNTVIGPPSNIAVTPDGRIALVADSLKINPQEKSETIPADSVHIVDLTSKPPKVVGQVHVGQQPSGMSITSDGKLALVANRADGTVSVLKIDGQNTRAVQQITVCEKGEQASDVTITPDGRHALVSINAGGYLRLLEIDGTRVTATERKLALSVIDLKADPVQTVDYIPIGNGPESIELSPDGRLLAVVLMNGSNLPADDPYRTQNGLLVVMARKGNTFVQTQELPIGRIPEGVAFTSDGRYLVVQCHPARELWVFKVDGGRVTDTSHRISVPGFPSSLRAAP